eukprot:JP443306.1.p2 GENE.JP443306.1~~JP443306.1.p2  ORF type:complete len:78 (+),score=3.32 JP443306.1:1-234(+)
MGTHTRVFSGCTTEGCDAPKSCSEPADTLHSSDIAFKPAETGWGYNPKFASNWDKIFAKKPENSVPTESSTPAKQSE